MSVLAESGLHMSTVNGSALLSLNECNSEKRQGAFFILFQCGVEERCSSMTTQCGHANFSGRDKVKVKTWCSHSESES